MNLEFDQDIAKNYKSPSQKIRVMSENWAVNNLFCPCCGNERLTKLPANYPVGDIQCDDCNEIFELKSKRGNIGNKINDGAYETMIERIQSNSNPELLILQYSMNLSVTDLMLIPKFFFVPSIIEKRKPLSSGARRAGWIGCNILYQEIPEQGKIKIIDNGKENKIKDIVAEYEQIRKLQKRSLTNRGWLFDVMNCINNIKTDEFTLKEIYSYIDYLKIRHSDNNNVEAKIRQQLQFLRDKGFIKFIGRGHYKKFEN